MIEQAVHVAFVEFVELVALEAVQLEQPEGQLKHCDVPPVENCAGKQAVHVPLLKAKLAKQLKHVVFVELVVLEEVLAEQFEQPLRQFKQAEAPPGEYCPDGHRTQDPLLRP